MLFVRILLIYCMLVVLTGCHIPSQIAYITPDNQRLSDSSQATDPEVAAMIAPYKAKFNTEMSAVIGQAARDMVKEKPESLLGNWAADAQWQVARSSSRDTVHMSVVNYGGLRIPAIKAGPITRGKVFELMPFDNRIVVLDIDGMTLQAFFDHMAADGGWPISQGIQYERAGKKAVRVMLHGQPLDTEMTYRLAVSDYIANGGDNSKMLTRLVQEDIGWLLRDAFIEEVIRQSSNGGLANARFEQRVLVVD